jgi:glycosyltransferase involved in cell wall biosynthesis
VSEPLRLSIIVVNYNNERFPAPAIDSALSESHPPCEVIVVDDAARE